MSSNIEIKCLKVMELAIKFIRKLTDEQLDNLISGDCQFNIENKKKRSAASKVKNKSVEKTEEDELSHIANKLKESEDREEAAKYIRSLKFTKDKLILLGVKLGINIAKRYNKDKIINVLVEETVGTKLKIEGLRKGIMGRNSS